jgi:multidrug resistance efflux pump
MPTRPWVPPATFNFIATLIAFGAAIGLAWMAWNYYVYTPWTRDGRVRVYTVQLAPEVSGTVVSLPIKDTQFVHKGDVLFQIDPRDYQNKLKQATGPSGADPGTGRLSGSGGDPSVPAVGPLRVS